MNIELYILIFFVTFASFTVSSISGGGVALIMTPFLMFIGVPPQIAVGTMKFATLGGISGIIRYAKAKKIDWKRIPTYVTISLVAVYFGTRLMLSTAPEQIEFIFGIATIFILPFIFFKQKWGILNKIHTKRKVDRILGSIFYFFVSIIQSAFGAGMGLFVTYIFVQFFGYNLVEANATRRVPLYALNIASVTVYLYSGVVDITLGFVLLAGTLLGNFLGAHISVTKGSTFVKYFFMTIILISACKLLFF